MEQNQQQPPVLLRILIIEDTADRQELLQSLYREHAWVRVHTAARAICLLRAYDFDLISLDYNLAGQDTGEAVALALENGRQYRSKKVPIAHRAESLPLRSVCPADRQLSHSTPTLFSSW